MIRVYIVRMSVIILLLWNSLPTLVWAMEEDFDKQLSNAHQLLHDRKWGEASTSFRSLFKKEPKSIQSGIGLATSLTYLGRRGEALSILDQLTRRVKSAEGKQIIQRIHVISRQFVTNSTSQIYQDGLNLLINKKYRNAREKFERALLDEPENIEILIRLGQSFILDGEIDLGIEKLKLAKRLNSYDSVIRLWLGRGYFLKNLLPDAVTELRSAFNEISGSELAVNWLADALVAEGQTQAAIRILDRDVKVWPFHIGSLLNLARLRSQSHQPQHQSSSAGLWSARKEVQLALSRLDQYYDGDLPQSEIELSLDLRKSPQEVRGEVQRLLLQIQGQLNALES